LERRLEKKHLRSIERKPVGGEKKDKGILGERPTGLVIQAEKDIPGSREGGESQCNSIRKRNRALVKGRREQHEGGGGRGGDHDGTVDGGKERKRRRRGLLAPERITWRKNGGLF